MKKPILGLFSGLYVALATIATTVGMWPSLSLAEGSQRFILGSGGGLAPTFASTFTNLSATGAIPNGMNYASAGVRYYWDAAGNLQTSPNNQVRNSTMQGCSAGVAPTNWYVNANTGWVASVVGCGQVDPVTGAPYIDISFTGTSNNTGGYAQVFPDTAISTAIGERDIASATIRLLSGTTSVAALFVGGPTGNYYTPLSTVAYATSSVNVQTTTTGGPGFIWYYGNSVASNFTVRITQPQFERVTAAQTTPNPFMPTSGSAYNGPVLNDHNPATGAALGLRTEPSRTNLILDNTMQGAVVGAPGTPPSNWTPQAYSGLSWSIAATGTVNGAPYVDLTISGTATTAGQNYILFSPNGSIADTATNYTLSAYTSVSGGSLTNITSGYLVLQEYTSGGTYINGTSVNLPLLSPISRVQTTLLGSGVNTLRTFFQISNSAGAVNVTFRVYLPQLEQVSFATTPILTYGSAVNVPADNWGFTGSTLAKLTSGSFCVAMDVYGEGNNGSGYPSIFYVSDGTINNRDFILAGPSNYVYQAVAAATLNMSPPISYGGPFVGAVTRISAEFGTINAYSFIGYPLQTFTGASLPVGMNSAGFPGAYEWFQQLVIYPSCTLPQTLKRGVSGSSLTGN